MMPADGKEKVLCVPTANLTRALRVTDLAPHRKLFQGFRPLPWSFQAGQFLDLLEEAGPVFKPRTKELEADPSLKQLIPYAVLLSRSRVYTYRRVGKDGDPRLRRKTSIGFGGHVNDCDNAAIFGAQTGPPQNQPTSLSATLLNGLRRELREELDLSAKGGISIRLAGAINDDSNPVGQVHLGLVYAVELAKPEVSPRAGEILGTGWVAAESLQAVAETAGEGYESWSRILIAEAMPSLCPLPAAV